MRADILTEELLWTRESLAASRRLQTPLGPTWRLGRLQICVRSKRPLGITVQDPWLKSISPNQIYLPGSAHRAGSILHFAHLDQRGWLWPGQLCSTGPLGNEGAKSVTLGFCHLSLSVHRRPCVCLMSPCVVLWGWNMQATPSPLLGMFWDSVEASGWGGALGSQGPGG